MKFIFSICAALAATAYAAPLVEFGDNPSALAAPGSRIDAKIGKVDIGGLETPAAYSHTLNTKTAPINYGNLNQGTGMMPSQVVHYGTENQPDRGYISPVLVSTTAKDVSFQLAKAEKAGGGLLNLETDVGKLQFPRSKYTDVNAEDYDDDDDDDDGIEDVDDENDLSKWRRGYWGHHWGRWRRPWGRHWGRRWGRHRRHW
ncbi:hypothetical protein KVV02_006872 [Mortierella alpina]|uniref:Uncharacterized protein n=1 Tax=Mortierella alpina TaxID=64518 RepID=A0A9P8A7T3_MORAP|nr:hypothetical protein KVV02_006872 [Mortierella alpina]